jgi:hypothetical protein
MRKACGTPARREIVPGRREIRKYSKNVSKSISGSDIRLTAQNLRRIRLKIHPQKVLLRRVCVGYTQVLRINGVGLTLEFG